MILVLSSFYLAPLFCYDAFSLQTEPPSTSLPGTRFVKLTMLRSFLTEERSSFYVIVFFVFACATFCSV